MIELRLASPPAAAATTGAFVAAATLTREFGSFIQSITELAAHL